jgi:hypothetical protein
MTIYQAIVFVGYNWHFIMCFRPEGYELVQVYFELRLIAKRAQDEREFPPEKMARFYELAQWAETNIPDLEYPPDYHTLAELDLEEQENGIA